MSAKQVDVNGTEYRVVLTEQVIGHVTNLKNLYNMAYEDPESFEDVSSEISNTINEIASMVEPAADDSDLDGIHIRGSTVIQDIMEEAAIHGRRRNYQSANVPM